MSAMSQSLIKFLRKNNGRPYGVLVAVKRPDGEISIDYSLCNLKKDRFTKQRALDIAFGRAMNSKKDESCDRTLPHSLVKEMDLFNKRAERYYRKSVDEIITW